MNKIIMNYRYTTKSGVLLNFENRSEYLRVYENQLRVERLAELNTELVKEEMTLEPEVLALYNRESQSSTEDK